MGKAIPPEIRGKIIAFHEAGMSQKWIVRETSTSLTSVQRFIRLHREDKGRACRQETGRFLMVKIPIIMCMLQGN